MLTPFVPALLVVVLDLAVLGPFDVLLEDRVEADDAAVERLVELEVLLLRDPPCPQRGPRRGEAAHVCEPCTCCLISVQGFDKCGVTCLSSFAAFEAAWYQPSFFDGCLVVRKPDMVETCRTASFHDLLREEIRLKCCS